MNTGLLWSPSSWAMLCCLRRESRPSGGPGGSLLGTWGRHSNINSTEVVRRRTHTLSPLFRPPVSLNDLRESPSSLVRENKNHWTEIIELAIILADSVFFLLPVKCLKKIKVLSGERIKKPRWEQAKAVYLECPMSRGPPPSLMLDGDLGQAGE